IDQRQRVRNQIIYEMAEKDPKTAMNLALQDEPSARNGLSTALAHWLQQEPEAAVAWLELQPESVRRHPAVSQSIQSLANLDANGAVRLIDFLPPSQAREETLNHILQSWAN